MIDFLSLNIDIQHESFGATRSVQRKGAAFSTIKQFAHKLELYPDACSIDVTSLNNGTGINIRSTPLKPLQGHNVFGSDNVSGFGFKLICFVLDALNIHPSPTQLQAWRSGDYKLQEVHITYRLKLDSHALVEPIILHLLRNVHHRLCPAFLPIGTGVTLSAPHRRAKWMMYDKLKYLNDKRHSEFKHLTARVGDQDLAEEVWSKLLKSATSNIRTELRLSKKYLTVHALDTASSWEKGKAKEIFLSELALLRLGSIPSFESVTQLVDELDDKLLRQAYRFWLLGDDLHQLFSTSALRAKRRAINGAIGVDILLDMPPSQTPPVDLSRVFSTHSILPNFPVWASRFERIVYKGSNLAEIRTAAVAS